MEEPDADQVLGQASEEKPVADEVLDQASGEKPDANEVPGPASAKDAACMPFGVGVGEPEMISSDDEATDSKPIKSVTRPIPTPARSQQLDNIRILRERLEQLKL